MRFLLFFLQIVRSRQPPLNLIKSTTIVNVQIGDETQQGYCEDAFEYLFSCHYYYNSNCPCTYTRLQPTASAEDINHVQLFDYRSD